MTCVEFIISEDRGGWFVDGGSRMGPFLSKQRALDLAEGMVTAIKASGGEATFILQVATKPAAVSAFAPLPDLESGAG